jgi:Uma2 family endonuclease
MSVSISKPTQPEIVYPDSDGEPMAENTEQYEWIVTVKGNLDILFVGQPNVFVAGDLLWYPVEGDPKIRTAPDTMVAIGRPKGYRGSYKQWEEGGIAPQVVFEILSPGNRPVKMEEKFQFYERYGVEEYYIYDPDTDELDGYRREGDELKKIPQMDGWVSPLLGIRFDCSGSELRITDPDGRPFLTFTELGIKERAMAHERDAMAHERDAMAHERDAALLERDRERERGEKLAARLRELGLNPEE